MVRTKRFRMVSKMPDFVYFKPQGVGIKDLDEVILTVDEYECIRLKDVEDYEQILAAKKMCVHQSTFQRNLTIARKKISDAIVNGKAIRIEGGNYRFSEVRNMPNKDGTGPRGEGSRTGRGLGKCNGQQGNNCNNKRQNSRKDN